MPDTGCIEWPRSCVQCALAMDRYPPAPPHPHRTQFPLEYRTLAAAVVQLYAVTNPIVALLCMTDSFAVPTQQLRWLVLKVYRVSLFIR
jgi:hypothetical protein